MSGFLSLLLNFLFLLVEIFLSHLYFRIFISWLNFVIFLYFFKFIEVVIVANKSNNFTLLLPLLLFLMKILGAVILLHFKIIFEQWFIRISLSLRQSNYLNMLSTLWDSIFLLRFLTFHFFIFINYKRYIIRSGTQSKLDVGLFSIKITKSNFIKKRSSKHLK